MLWKGVSESGAARPSGLVPLSVLPVSPPPRRRPRPRRRRTAAVDPVVSLPAGAPPLAERDRIIAAMEESGWVQAKAARLLGLTPRQIRYALKK